jgi:hypothetical protein
MDANSKVATRALNLAIAFGTIALAVSVGLGLAFMVEVVEALSMADRL